MATNARAPGWQLGAQVWLERDSSAEAVASLMKRAADCGLGQVRIFLMWPWIEPEPGQRDFGLFDAAFDHAEENRLRVKATLTANSGPWWLGTGGVLHSHTTFLDEDQYPAVRSYVRACVARYKDHPALGQWILWNEPFNPPHGPYSQRDPGLALWPEVLERQYGNIRELNRQWQTGYASFGEVPHIDSTYNAAHRGMPWRSFAPLLDDCRLRSAVLVHDLRLVAEAVRELDPRTPLCANPNLTLLNHAESGYDLPALGAAVDVLGATFHAPWTFAFAPRSQHVPLMLAGLSLLSSTPGVAAAEVTEMQLGNAYLAGNRPLGVTSGQVAASFLFPVLAGAETVTGWDLNARQQGYEAGEWALLDNMDEPTDRAESVARVSAALERLGRMLGAWSPHTTQAWVVVSAESQAVQYAHGELQQQDDPGRGRHEAIQGAALLTAKLRTMGVASALVPGQAVFSDATPDVIVASHMVAWTEEFAARLLSLAWAGATVLIDGTSGEYGPEGALHRPWPGGLTSVGLRSRGLVSRADGQLDWGLELFGAPAGVYPAVRSDPVFDRDAGWSPLTDIRIADYSRLPAAWRRRYGAGQLIYALGALGPAALRPESAPALRYLLTLACQNVARAAWPADDRTTVVQVHGPRGTAFGVWAAHEPGARRVTRLGIPPGRYADIWNGTELDHPGPGEIELVSTDGICLLVSTDN